MAAEDAQAAGAGEAPIPPQIYVPVRLGERLFQGEIIEGVLEWIAKYDASDPDQVVGVEPRLQRLAVILSQDCDLAQDWGRRQSELREVTDLRSVLMCPAWPAEQLREEQKLTTRRWEVVRQNKDERYAYLADVPPSADGAGQGHPALLLDLASYFTVRTSELYRQLRDTSGAPRRRCRLATPWREHLQCRFAGYQARIGLPMDHFVPEGRRPSLPI